MIQYALHKCINTRLPSWAIYIQDTYTLMGVIIQYMKYITINIMGIISANNYKLAFKSEKMVFFVIFMCLSVKPTNNKGNNNLKNHCYIILKNNT